MSQEGIPPPSVGGVSLSEVVVEEEEPLLCSSAVRERFLQTRSSLSTHRVSIWWGGREGQDTSDQDNTADQDTYTLLIRTNKVIIPISTHF